MDLKKKVKKLPLTPGVYLMKDSLDSIIYVGKSKCLKKRVQSYFQNSKSHTPKIEKLIKNLKNFDYILTDTEFEAFMLECKLIKELKPMYNKLMKSPLSYTYIGIQTSKEYSNIKLLTDTVENDCDFYFGPYTSKSTVERAIQGIKECYKIICSNPSKKNTTCLNYSLDLCIGMCFDDSATKQYNSIINKTIALLKGTDKSIIYKMKQKMSDASEKFDFETAAKYRDYLSAINFLVDKEKVIEFTEKNKNIIVFEQLDKLNAKLFIIKKNRVIFSVKYNLDDSEIGQLITSVKNKILLNLNNTSLSSTSELSKDEIDEAQIIYSYLKSSNCRYTTVPEKWLESTNDFNIDKELRKLLTLSV